MQKEFPTEILQKIIQYSDTLIRATLGFPTDKMQILEEGGPGKVLDEFLRRNGNLEYLKKWIPGECALMHGVLTKDPKKILEIDRIWRSNMSSNQGYELSVATKFIWGVDHIKHDREYINMEEYYAFTRQWNRMKKPINIYSCHPKYLVDTPEEYLDRDGKIMVALYKGEKIGIESWTICRCCIKYNMYKEALSIAPNNCNIIHELYLGRCTDGLKYLKDLGIISGAEFRAYEICMNPEDGDLINVLDDNNDEDMKIYDMAMDMSTWFMESRLPDASWDRDMEEEYEDIFEDIGCTDTTWERMLERALKLGLQGRIVKDGRGARIREGKILYTYPSSIRIRNTKDVSAIDMTLFFWAKYEMGSPSAG